MKRRIAFIQILFVAAFFILGAKSVYVQIIQADELTKKAAKDHSRLVEIKGERGEILDRHHNKLATSTPAISVASCPKHITAPARTAGAISEILGLDPRRLEKTFATKRLYARIARKITPEQAAQIKRLNLRGIYFEDDFRRMYPHRETAAQVIGIVGSEENGLEGLELKLNSILEGRTGTVRVKRYGNGSLLAPDRTTRAALKGHSVVLTIDKKIQYLSEQALEKTVQENQAASGMALVMKPSTGEMLAIAHYPRFNPNNYMGLDKAVFRNRSVTDPFEPGSVTKIFTAAAAIEKGFSPRSIFYCENGTYAIGDFTIHDTHPHHWLSINQIIKFSSNIGAAKIVETLGYKSLYTHLTAFGFGQKTQIGCPAETTGRLRHHRRWSQIDAGAIAFGQGLSVSAVQLISAVSAIANDGRLMQPFLVKKILSNTGETQRINHPRMIRQAVARQTARKIKKMMSMAVQEDGTGYKAAIKGYAVCGKTGTAQKVAGKNKGYSKTDYIAVFAGFAPLDNPQLAVLVVVDEPRKNYYGGDVAAPAFRTILADTFSYLNIPPESDQPLLADAMTGERQ